jgi:hypothetical protein
MPDALKTHSRSLECLYRMLGTRDAIAIAQLPDSAHAAALSTMIRPVTRICTGS